MPVIVWPGDVAAAPSCAAAPPRESVGICNFIGTRFTSLCTLEFKARLF
jgi:hypothetical protein